MFLYDYIQFTRFWPNPQISDFVPFRSALLREALVILTLTTHVRKHLLNDYFPLCS